MQNAKDLFQLQTELIDTKVTMAVNQVIDKVVNQIIALKGEMHEEIRGVKGEIHTLNDRFASVDNRLIAVETKLGMVNDAQRELRSNDAHMQREISNRIIDYAFKIGWFFLGLAAMYVLVHH
jgi:chromosome segregation ATPase